MLLPHYSRAKTRILSFSSNTKRYIIKQYLLPSCFLARSFSLPSQCINNNGITTSNNNYKENLSVGGDETSPLSSKVQLGYSKSQGGTYLSFRPGFFHEKRNLVEVPNSALLNLCHDKNVSLVDLLLNVKTGQADSGKTFDTIMGVADNDPEFNATDLVLKKAVDLYCQEDVRNPNRIAIMNILSDHFYFKLDEESGAKSSVNHYQMLKSYIPPPRKFKALKYWKRAVAKKNSVHFRDQELEKLLEAAAVVGFAADAESIFKTIVSPSSKAFQLIISAFGKAGNTEEAFNYWSKYAKSTVSIQNGPVLAYAQSLVDNNQTAQALHFLTTKVSALNYFCTIDDYNKIIYRIVSLGRVDEAQELFELLRDDTSFPNCNSVTDALGLTIYSLQNNFQEAEKYFDPLFNWKEIANDIPDMSFWFGRLCLINGKRETAIKVFEDSNGDDLILFLDLMQTADHSQPIHWFSRCIPKLRNTLYFSSFSTWSGLKLAFEYFVTLTTPKDIPLVLDIAVKHNIFPGINNRNAIMKLYLEYRKVERDHHLSESAYLLLLSICAEDAHHHNHLIDIFEEMVASGIKPTAKQYDLILHIIKGNLKTTYKWKNAFRPFLSTRQVIIEPVEISKVLAVTKSIEDKLKIVRQEINGSKWSIPQKLAIEMAEQFFAKGDTNSLQYLWEHGKGEWYLGRWIDLAYQAKDCDFSFQICSQLPKNTAVELEFLDYLIESFSSRGENEKVLKLIMKRLELLPNEIPKAPTFHLLYSPEWKRMARTFGLNYSSQTIALLDLASKTLDVDKFVKIFHGALECEEHLSKSDLDFGFSFALKFKDSVTASLLVLKEAKRQKFVLNARKVDLLFESVVKSNDHANAKLILDYVQECNQPFNAIHYKFILQDLLDEGNNDRARFILKKLAKTELITSPTRRHFEEKLGMKLYI